MSAGSRASTEFLTLVEEARRAKLAAWVAAHRTTTNVRAGQCEASSLQLRPVARLDFGLAFRLAELGLIMDHLADARKHRAFDPRLRRPQLCAHQRLAAVEIGLVHRYAQHRARQLAELLHRGQQIRLG